MKAQISKDLWSEYESAGTGQVVLLLHAFPLCGAMWQPQKSALQKDYRVVVPDLRGFGGSSPFSAAPSLDQMADDVVNLLDALKITNSVVLGGLSMGGYIALAVARKYPSRLRGLILADTRAEADDDNAKAGRDKMIAFARTHSSRDVIDQLLPKMLSAKTLAERPSVAQEVARLASAQTSQSIIDALNVLRDRPDAKPYLARIRVPTLVLVGSEDVLTPPASAEALAASIPEARLEVIPGAGHLSNLEQPDLFNASLLSFLGSLSDAAAKQAKDIK